MKITIDMVVLCPFCKGAATIGRNEEGLSVLLHSLPTCKTYDDKTPDEFLRAARERLQS